MHGVQTGGGVVYILYGEPFCKLSQLCQFPICFSKHRSANLMIAGLK